MSKIPKTFLEAVRYFSDAENCLNFLVALRWPRGVKCPQCGSKKVTFLKNAKLWKCRNEHPKQKFSIKVGTIFEDSPIGLDKWFPAMWLAANCKNGISSYELARALGVTQKTAWFMLQRIRLAMQSGSLDKMKGPVEADETFIGAKARNVHKSKRGKYRAGTVGKTAVMGLLERNALMVFYFEGEYKDTSGHSYPLTYCRIYNQNAPSSSLIFCDGWGITFKKPNE
jgi:hypothetical protein